MKDGGYVKTNNLWAETLQAILNRQVQLKVDLLGLQANPNFSLLFPQFDAMLIWVDESADLVRDLLYGKDETIRRLVRSALFRLAEGPSEEPPGGTPPGR
jgi:hypothetical protein